MSVNLRDKDTGELVTLASGVRMWIGSKAAHSAAVEAGTMPNNVMVCLTDDYEDNNVIEEDITERCTFERLSDETNKPTVLYTRRGNTVVISVNASKAPFTITTGSNTFTITLPSDLPKLVSCTGSAIVWTNTANDQFCGMPRLINDRVIILYGENNRTGAYAYMSITSLVKED